MAKLSRLLKTDSIGNLIDFAQLLQSKGRGKDTILAHITPAEAKRLKAAGGRGSRNPATGLLEFDDVPVPSLPNVTATAQATPAPSSQDSYTPVVDIPQTSGSTSGASDYSGIPYTPAADGGAQGGAPTGQAFSGEISPPLSIPQPDFTGQQQPTQEQLDSLQPVKVEGQYEKAPSWLAKQFGKLSGSDLARLGIAGVGGLAGVINSRKTAGQIGAAQQEQQALATPYQEQGRALTQAAAAGQLSPASAQSYQAAKAQMQQQSAQRGGVGVEQMAAQLEGFRQQLLQQQYTYGLQIAQIGDNISLGAIRTGLQLDAQLQQASQGFYTSLAAIAAGVPLKTGP